MSEQTATLNQLQRAFSRCVAGPAQDWKGDEAGVRQQPTLSTARRIGIYHYAYSARIGDSLVEDFSGVASWLGEASLRQCVRPYLELYPSLYHSLAEVSRHFPEFLRKHPPSGAPEFIAELAEWEWHQILTVNTDARPLPETRPNESLESQNFSQVRLALNPSLTLFESRWPVDTLMEKMSLPVAPRLTRLAAWCTEDDYHELRIQSTEWNLLLLLNKHTNVSDFLAQAQGLSISTDRFSRLFTLWSNRRWIQGWLP